MQRNLTTWICSREMFLPFSIKQSNNKKAKFVAKFLRYNLHSMAMKPNSRSKLQAIAQHMNAATDALKGVIADIPLNPDGSFPQRVAFCQLVELIEQSNNDDDGGAALDTAADPSAPPALLVTVAARTTAQSEAPHAPALGATVGQEQSVEAPPLDSAPTSSPPADILGIILHELKQELRASTARLEKKIDETREELRAELHETREELRAELHETRKELRAELDETRGMPGYKHAHDYSCAILDPVNHEVTQFSGLIATHQRDKPYLLTAAHCVVDLDQLDFMKKPQYVLTSSGTFRFNVKSVHIVNPLDDKKSRVVCDILKTAVKSINGAMNDQITPPAAFLRKPQSTSKRVKTSVYEYVQLLSQLFDVDCEAPLDRDAQRCFVAAQSLGKMLRKFGTDLAIIKLAPIDGGSSNPIVHLKPLDALLPQRNDEFMDGVCLTAVHRSNFFVSKPQQRGLEQAIAGHHCFFTPGMPGYSGAPVFLTNGHLAGLHLGGGCCHTNLGERAELSAKNTEVQFATAQMRCVKFADAPKHDRSPCSKPNKKATPLQSDTAE